MFARSVGRDRIAELRLVPQMHPSFVLGVDPQRQRGKQTANALRMARFAFFRQILCIEIDQINVCQTMIWRTAKSGVPGCLSNGAARQPAIGQIDVGPAFQNCGQDGARRNDGMEACCRAIRLFDILANLERRLSIQRLSSSPSHCSLGRCTSDTTARREATQADHSSSDVNPKSDTPRHAPLRSPRAIFPLSYSPAIMAGRSHATSRVPHRLDRAGQRSRKKHAR